MFGLLDPERDLIDGLNNHRYDDDIKILEGLNQDHKWLAASSLQKSIRRGMVKEALYAAHVLKSFSPTHLWNRLAVIALEDIGLANINLAAQVLWVAGKAQWRIKHRGDDFILSHLIHKLCNSKACRTLDDVLYCVEYHPLYSQQRMIYSGMNEDDLCRLFHDESLDVIERSLIGRYLCGRRYRSETLKLDKGNPIRIIDLAHGVNAPPYVLDILNLSKGQEYFTCLLPCLMQFEKSPFCETVSDINDTPRMAGAYPDFAYDKHTRMGKQSFRQLLKSCPDILAFIHKHCERGDPVNIAGWGDFILSGRLLDKRIIYDGSECLRELAAQAWLYSGGMPIEAQPDFLSLMDSHKEELFNARRSVAR